MGFLRRKPEKRRSPSPDPTPRLLADACGCGTVDTCGAYPVVCTREEIEIEQHVPERRGWGRRKSKQKKKKKVDAVVQHPTPTIVESRQEPQPFHFLSDTRQRKAVYHRFSAHPEQVLSIEQDEEMPPLGGDDHVLLKVQASTVTLNDCLLRNGFDFSILDPVSLPVTPGSDVVGHVVKCGKKVQDFLKGDRVAALVRTGGNARYISVPASSLVDIPRHVDSASAVCMVSVYSTAFQALKMVSLKRPVPSLKGKTVLVIGGMDPVGQALIHLCIKAKASAVYVVSPIASHHFIRLVLGATPLPYATAAWTRKLSAKVGKVDIVFDGICNDLGASKRVLTEKGKLVCFGNSAVLKEQHLGILVAPLSTQMKQMFTWNKQKIDIWNFFQHHPEEYKENLQVLMRLVKWQKVRPLIGKRIGLTELARAQMKVEKMESRGITILYPWRHVGSRKIVESDERREG